MEGCSDACAWLSPRQVRLWTVLFLALGVLARCVRYFLRFPLWEDESFLCTSFIDRDYAGLMEPLEYHPQVAPLLFLWAELSLVKLLGFSELSLRLISFISSLGSLALFYRLASRCLSGLPFLFALGLFSVTYGCVRYAAEAKPYGSDLFLALIMYSLALNWLDTGRARWLWILAGFMPFAIGFSYPAILVGSGLILTVTFWMWREKRWDPLPLLGFALSVLVSFGGFYFLSLRGQMQSDLEGMHECWGRYFPPLTEPLQLLPWLFKVHAEDILAYPFGSGASYGAILSLPYWVAGLVLLARRGQWSFLVFCLAPMAAHLGAAALRRYPYGGAFKFVVYLGPLVCMVLAYGMAETAAWLARRGQRRALFVYAPLIFLVVVGSIVIARDLAWPFKSRADQQACGFAQWFWCNMERKGEVVCLKSDLNLNFTPRLCKRLNLSAEYFCNQRIYSPRRAAGADVAWDKISAEHPLFCVQYRSLCVAFDDKACQDWLAEMQRDYVLLSRVTYPMIRQDKRETVVRENDFVEVFEFVPRLSSSSLAAATMSQTGVAP